MRKDIDLDTEGLKRQNILEKFKKVFGEENVLNIATFKTEKSRSAILTACRSLEIDLSIAEEMADLIPIERGNPRDLETCLFGNDELKPITRLVNMISLYPNLKEIALYIQGIIVARSSHTSGIYIFKNGFLEVTSLMKTPNGTHITCSSMKDTDACGGLKFDLLTIEALDKIRKTMEFLIDNKLIEKQNTLRETYNKYIHPDVIDYTDSEMFDYMSNNEITDLFQFNTPVGMSCVKEIKPKNLQEMISANDVMRLMKQDGVDETPLEKYVRFKNDINEWYKEMKENKLNKEEIEILKQYLSHSYGIAVEQEDIMKLVMNENISSFGLAEANKLRKAVGKKDKVLMEEVKQAFFKNNNTNLSNYVWNFCIMPQAGYSFSICHSTPYAIISLIEMNLYTKYPKILWETACLSVNACSDEGSDKNSDYGKIAIALSLIKQKGINIRPPYINEAYYDFYPDIKTSTVFYSLKAMQGINNTAVNTIIENRNYFDLNDFLDKNIKNLTNSNIIALIKAGCFDKIESKLNREQVMDKYLAYKFISEGNLKETIDGKNLQKIISLGILKGIYSNIGNLWKLRKNLKKDKVRKTYNFEKEDIEILKNDFNIEVKEIELIKNFDKTYNDVLEKLKNLYSDKNFVEEFNLASLRAFIKENKKDEYNLSKWEMDSLNTYIIGEHELENTDYEKYQIKTFKELKENELAVFCGTVIQKDKDKHIVTLLTTKEVVTLKYSKGQFINYNKKDSNYFGRGNKIVVTGLKRGDFFIVKRKNNCHSTMKINIVDNKLAFIN